ncbi:hypothetical protein ABFT80_20900 [Mesorhizobium sp. SB112]|uniref:hypothetical protein n=1 Tax=Mesorhizobium sp. SB112 TaxID=3151853 RepID=UPI003262F021
MSNSSKDNVKKQILAAKEAADKYHDALSMLAKSEPKLTPDMQAQIEVAKKRMEKYKVAYRALAK